MAKLKVYGKHTIDAAGKLRRAVVATTSKKKAAHFFGCSLYEFNLYGAETGNELEVKVAMAEPGKLHFTRDD